MHRAMLISIALLLAALGAFAAQFDAAALVLFIAGLMLAHRSMRRHLPPDQFDA